MEEFAERQIGDLTVRIDRLTCIASANCMKVASDIFEIDSEKVCAFKASRPDIERDRMIEACRVCPVDALIVIDADGKQLVP